MKIENTTIYKIVIGIVLLAFWWISAEKLTLNSGLTVYFISFSYGMLAVVSIVIQLVLKEDIQKRMKEVLNAEIKERKRNYLMN